MKRLLKYRALWIAAIATILTASCSDSLDEGYATYGEGEGCVELSIALTESRAADSSALDNSVLKIYDSSNRLVRRYQPATEMPESIYILAGDYSATLTVGDSQAATTDATALSYYGECDFAVTALATSQIELNCPMLNCVVEVSFDSSIEQTLSSGYSLRMVSVDEGESYSTEAYDSNYAVNMEFMEDGVGYFIIPEGENLAWSFTGEREKTTGEVVDVTGAGIIESPTARKKYSLTFKYTTKLEVTSLQVDVDTSTDDYDDSMNFTPQPIITTVDFELNDSHLPDQDYTFTINGLNNLSQVEITAGVNTLHPLMNGEAVDVEGALYTKVDDMNGSLTLSPSLFESYEFGGEQSVTITATDIVNASRTVSMPITVTGITTLTEIDYWGNTATLSALVLDDEAEVVTIEYRNPGDTDWYSATATKGDGNIYSIKCEADWVSGANSVATIYTLAFGISPANEYECRLTIDGVSKPVATISTDDSDAQTIVNSDVPKTLDCYKVNDSSSSTSWCSGNNSYAESLCVYGAYGGEGCAYLASTVAAGKFAAGNLVYGQFLFSSFSGTMSFGQPFTWTARPKSLKVRYAASVNEVSSYTYSGKLAAGDIDPARIFIAIVNWGSSRHEVTAGTSTTASGIWDPETQTSTSEGAIIGYGSLFIKESTTSSTLTDAEIEIFYYDNATKPTDGNVSLVISCAASAYGDYFAGSIYNKLWVRDFEFGY